MQGNRKWRFFHFQCVWKQHTQLTVQLILLLWLFRPFFCSRRNHRINQVPSLLHPLVSQHNLQVLLAVILKHRVPDALSARGLHKNAIHASPSDDSIDFSLTNAANRGRPALRSRDCPPRGTEPGFGGLRIILIKENYSACSIFRWFAASADRQCRRCTSLWILRCSRSRSVGIEQGRKKMYLQFLQFLEFLRMMRFQLSDLGFLCRFLFVALHDFLTYFLEVLKNNTSHSLTTDNHTAHNQLFRPQ